VVARRPGCGLRRHARRRDERLAAAAGGRQAPQVTAWKADAPILWLAWSLDGKSLAVVRDTSTIDLVLIQNFR